MVKSKKKAVKKASKSAAKTARKSPAKQKAKVYVKIKSKILGEAPQEREFYLSDGRKLKSIYELVDALESMGDDMFSSYVNDSKNDFSNWIKDVFEEPNVAKEIEQIRSKIETQRLLIRQLVEAAKKAQ